MELKPLDREFPFRGDEAIDADALEVFPYEYAGRRIEVVIDALEFTAVCPFSGLPDFGVISITYVPGKKCIELRSLKYYLLSYRNVGIFYEHLVNRVLDDLMAVCQPIEMTVIADYTVRGGLKTRAKATMSSQEDTLS